jgi:hypothetical protein
VAQLKLGVSRIREDVVPSQTELGELLRDQFPGVPVTVEWPAIPGELQTYSPRVDIAVGPYAVAQRFMAVYDQMASGHAPFLERIHRVFESNVRALDGDDRVPSLQSVCSLNGNARCFLAIEIDNSGSRKHLMGGAVNAAALGRVGISVGGNPGMLTALLRTRRYLRFLASVGKNTFNTDNLVIVSIDQLAEALTA